MTTAAWEGRPANIAPNRKTTASLRDPREDGRIAKIVGTWAGMCRAMPHSVLFRQHLRHGARDAIGAVGREMVVERAQVQLVERAPREVGQRRGEPDPALARERAQPRFVVSGNAVGELVDV